MRAISTDIKVLVSRLGPAAAQALQGAIRLTMSAGGAEVTTDHLVRALLDLPDCDLCVAMNAAGIARVDVGARLDWHLGRLAGGQRAKPILSQALCVLLEDAGKLTTDRVRTGHIVGALLADPTLSAAGIAGLFAALPREPLHLLASRVEDRGEVGRAAATAPAAAAPTAAKPVEAPPPRPPAAERSPAPEVADAGAAGRHAPVDSARARPAGRDAPTNAAALRAHLGDRVEAADGGGLTLAARVGGHRTTMRLDWDTDARVLVLRIALPADPPKDEVSAAVALSTLNNALPHGAFVLDEGRLAFRSHVFLDADGNAPVETVAFAVRVCEQAAEALGAVES